MDNSDGQFPDRSFILRQASHLAAEGTSAEALAARLREVLGDEHAASIESALAGDRGAWRNRLFERMEAVGRELGLSDAGVAVAGERLRQEMAAAVTPGFKVFRGLAIYLSTLALFMTALLALFTQSVLPVFTQMFADFGADLPGPTATVLRADVQLAMIAVPLLTIAALWIFGIKIRRVLLLRRGASGLITWLPVFGRLTRRFQPLLEVMVFETLWRAGAEPGALIGRLTHLVTGADPGGAGRAGGHLGACLAAACQLGTLEVEIRHWREVHETELMLSMVRARDVIVLLVQVLLGACIGYLVIAMYLPIFTLGSAI